MTDKTINLMSKLSSTESSDELDQYLKEIKDKYPNDLGSYIKTILDERGMTVSEMQQKSYINRTYIYQIIDGSRKPNKDKIIAIALACNMTLLECQRALEIAQQGILYAKNRRDSLMIYAINNKLSIMDLNSLLDKYELPELELEKK